MKKPIKCPSCGNEMMYIHGRGWDHDRWYCVHKIEGKAGVCGHEIELNVSTFVDIGGSEHEVML